MKLHIDLTYISKTAEFEQYVVANTVEPADT